MSQFTNWGAFYLSFSSSLSDGDCMWAQHTNSQVRQKLPEVRWSRSSGFPLWKVHDRPFNIARVRVFVVRAVRQIVHYGPCDDILVCMFSRRLQSD